MAELVLHAPAGRPWGMPNLSPFCAKLETYLRITETPYRSAPAQMQKAPKGKIPYVELDGKLVGDSQLVIEELERRAKQPLDAGLGDRDRALGRVIRRTIEEATYFTGIYTRWYEDDGWTHVAPEIKKLAPAVLAPLIGVIRRRVKKNLHAQGTGRHSRDDVFAMGADDWTAVAELLGDRPFVLGDAPRTVDCTVYAFLEGNLRFPSDTPIKARINGHANLIAYRDRVRARWWKDLG